MFADTSLIGMVESEEHKEMVKGIIDYFTEKEFTVQCADYDGYDECEKVGRHEPDVIAYDANGMCYIGEVETCKSLDDEITEEQFVDYSDTKIENGNSKGAKAQFYPLVPKSCMDDLKQKLQDLNCYPQENVHPLEYG